MSGRRNSNLYSGLGSTGLMESWGYITSDFLNEWNGVEKIKRVKEMLYNSPVVGAMRMALELPLLDIEWQFTGPADVTDDDPGLTILRDSLDSLKGGWRNHLSSALLAPFYGWSLFTIQYKQDGGRILWHDFREIGQDTIERWVFNDDDSGDLDSIRQFSYLWPDPLPYERCLHYRLRTTQGNPEGESALRPGWIPYYYIRHLQQMEGIGLERHLAGLPVIRMPYGSDPTESTDPTTDYGRAAQLVRNIRLDQQGGVVLPPPPSSDAPGWELTLLSGGSSNAPDTSLVISRYEKRLLMSMLSQFLMLGQDSVGALATFQGGVDFHTVMLNAVADMVTSVINTQAIPRLLRLNGIDPTGYQLQHSPAGEMQIETIGQFLTQAGGLLSWTPEDEAWLRSLARMPEKTTEELQDMAEARDERTDALRQAIESRMPDDTEPAGMSWFAAGRPPDERERQKLERRLQKRLSSFLTDQQKRVAKEARRNVSR